MVVRRIMLGVLTMKCVHGRAKEIEMNMSDKLKNQIAVAGVSATKAAYLSNGMEAWEFNWWLAQVMGQVGTLGQLRLVPMNDGMQEARYPTVS